LKQTEYGSLLQRDFTVVFAAIFELNNLRGGNVTDLSKNTGLLQINKDAQGILRVTLDDPTRRNALSEAMLDRLGTILADAAVDASVRVIVLAASGPAFCAGHDLKEMSAGRANADQARPILPMF